jgi:hypothetical protein
MSTSNENGPSESLTVGVCAGKQISVEDLTTCIRIIGESDPIDAHIAFIELPNAPSVAIVRNRVKIVAVGAIKQVRERGGSNISHYGGVSLPSDTLELAYIAVNHSYRGQRLSRRIVAELVARHPAPIFAITSNRRMKKTLTRVGFMQKGYEWQSHRYHNVLLSLWWKD